jgi:hypothetical protein
MKKTKATDLLPLADKYLEGGLNVLLVGPHGTGKTQSILDLTSERGMKIAYYSCSTLDPYTDLVGVPVPQVDENGRDYLKMVRPLRIDEAEFIFFDEFNRADAKTLNAIFEIIQFRTINGEALPKLKACWAAMNPDDGDYNVDEVDPALLDRFDVYIEVEPRPSKDYMAQFVTEDTAIALLKWWNEHETTEKAKRMASDKKKSAGRDIDSYVSPRRLLKIGLIWEMTKGNSGIGNSRAVKAALPWKGIFDTQKLVKYLRESVEGVLEVEDPNMGDTPADFTYTSAGIYMEKDKVTEYLVKNPNALETHKRVLDALQSGVSGGKLMERFPEVLNAVNPQLFEAYFNKLPTVKQSQLRSGFKALHEKDAKLAKSLTSLYNVIKAGARPGSLPTI